MIHYIIQVQHQEIHNKLTKFFNICVFSYLWRSIHGNTRNRSVGSHDGIAREADDRVYRWNVTNHICKDFYNKHPDCCECRKQEVLISLREVKENSFMEDNIIIGVLNDIEWVVVRWVRVNNRVDDAISTAAKMGTRGGTWFSLETKDNSHQMKYKYKQSIRQWNGIRVS